MRDVEVMCQENESSGGDLVRKVRHVKAVILVLQVNLSRSWISCTKQRMALLFLTRKRELLLHLRKKRNINLECLLDMNFHLLDLSLPRI